MISMITITMISCKNNIDNIVYYSIFLNSYCCASYCGERKMQRNIWYYLCILNQLKILN